MHRDSDRYQVQLAPSLVGQKRLGSYLVDAGLINQGQVQVALNDQKATGMKFGEILATRGWVKQQTIEYIMEKVVLPERKHSPTNPSKMGTTLIQTNPADYSHKPTREPNASSHHRQNRVDSRPQSQGAQQKQSSSRRYTQTERGVNTETSADKRRRTPPISKPLPSVSANNDGINWVG